MKHEQYQNQLAEKQERLQKLESELDQTKNKIADKLENLESLKQGADTEERLNELRSHLSSLKSKRAELKSERAETVSELAEKRRLIERYKDQELIGDLDDVASELRDLMSVPDRCPVCMNDVDEDQRRNLTEHHHCPLCAKEMPEDRIRSEKEYQAPDSVSERRKHQQEEISELRDEEQDLEMEVESLESRISTTEEDITEVEEQIREDNLEKIVRRREQLEDEIRQLRREAVSMEVEIESIEQDTDNLIKEIEAQEHLKQIRADRKEKISYLERLSGLVDKERKNQRKKLQSQLSERMETIVDTLNKGAFSDATAVSFDSPDNYHFTVHTPSRKYKTSQADKESAEATLYSLIFHSGVLKHLSEVAPNSIPIRFFIVDSPFSNDMDPGNLEDVTSLISHLPEYLEDYQTLVTMAKPEEHIIKELREGGHNLLDFSQVD
jgi:DNA repair exonuclease SbcCD ATPase subunit